MKPVQLLVLCLAAACLPASAQSNVVTLQRPAAVGGRAEQAIMDRIERDIRLPRGADRLAAYDRYYAWHQGTAGVRTVAAIYVSHAMSSGAQSARRWVAETDLPGIDDGGCSVVSFSYDAATRRFAQLGCNGIA